MAEELLTAEDTAFLMEFLAVPSVSPLEGGDPRAVMAAQRLFAHHAGQRGYRVEWLTPDQEAVAADPLTPVPLREHLRRDPTLLAHQPIVIARMGAANSPEVRRIVFNFHVDTVGPHVPPTLRGDVLHGRGALDDKGPGVALLAGVATAVERDPVLFDHVEVLICCVPGEEGGAMGGDSGR
jgi:acetylornithine deacetylase/succinyl-diaminopimelate desuccinylase-like protein